MISATFTAKEGKNNFGRMLDKARLSPVAIEKNGRRVAVVMSAEEYDELELRRDALWGERAKQAHNKGYIGVAKSRAVLKNALNACD